MSDDEALALANLRYYSYHYLDWTGTKEERESLAAEIVRVLVYVSKLRERCTILEAK